MRIQSRQSISQMLFHSNGKPIRRVRCFFRASYTPSDNSDTAAVLYLLAMDNTVALPLLRACCEGGLSIGNIENHHSAKSG